MQKIPGLQASGLPKELEPFTSWKQHEEHLEFSEAIVTLITADEMKQNVKKLPSCTLFYITEWSPFILLLLLLD